MTASHNPARYNGLKMSLLRRAGGTLSEVSSRSDATPRREINVEGEDKQGKIDQLAARYSDGEIDYLDGITVNYPDWWFNVRPKEEATSPLCRMRRCPIRLPLDPCITCPESEHH